MKITESQLRKIIKESINKVLNDINDSNAYTYCVWNNISGRFEECDKPKYVNGFAMVSNEDGNYNFIDKNGKLLSPNKWFTDADDFSRIFQNSNDIVFAVVRPEGEEDNHILDANGNILTSLEFERKKLELMGKGYHEFGNWQREWEPYDGWRP